MSQNGHGHYHFDNAAGMVNSSEVYKKIFTTVTVNGKAFTDDREITRSLELKHDADSRSGQVQ